MKLIKAGVDDVPRIMECAREFTSVIPDCQLDEAHYAESWRGFLNAGNGVILLLETAVGQVAGGLGGIVHPDLLSGKLNAVELFWYVKPEYRGGTWPVRLLREFEVWAATRGCDQVCMIHMECSMPARLKEFYLRSGYQLIETVYRKNLNSRQQLNMLSERNLSAS